MYRDDPCSQFTPKILDENIYDAVDPGLAAKMHKAIAVIQFKAEGQIIKRHPGYKMDDRILLEAVDYSRGVVTIEGTEYPMLDTMFPTIDPKHPLRLTKEEDELLHTLITSFRHSGLLHKQDVYKRQDIDNTDLVKLSVFPNPPKAGENIRGISVSAPIQNLNRNQMAFRRKTAAGAGGGISISADNSAYMSAMSVVIIGKPFPSDYVPESGASV